MFESPGIFEVTIGVLRCFFLTYIEPLCYAYTKLGFMLSVFKDA